MCAPVWGNHFIILLLLRQYKKYLYRNGGLKKKFRPWVKLLNLINLIPFNPFPGSDYKRVTNTALNRFRDILQGEGYTVTVRTTRGDDIAAACGQLAGEVNDRTKRQQRYKNKLAAQEVPVKMLDWPPLKI